MSKDDVLITVYTHSIWGRDVQIRLSKEIFLDEQPEAIGKVIIDAWKAIKRLDPTTPKEGGV